VYIFDKILSSPKHSAAIGILVAIIFLFSLNILVTNEIKTAQLDLTEDKLFTLSSGTKKILGAVDEPIIFRFYYSHKLGKISPVHGNYSKRVMEMLEQLSRLSNQKIVVKLIFPDPFSEEEDEAVRLGIQGIPLDQSAEMGYFGITANNSTDDRRTIAFLNPQREQFLEYDLARIVFELTSPKKKKVGLVAGLLLEADPLLRYKPWPIMSQITQFFEVKSIDSTSRVIPKDIDVLLLVHPTILKDSFRYAIDQFVMRGGRIVAFIDPQNETARMSPQAPPGAGSSDMKKLFEHWGIKFDPDKFVGDRTAAVRVNAQVQGREVIADYLSYNVFQKRSLNQQDVITSQLSTIQLASAGHLSLKEGSKLDIVPLLTTSKQSQHIDAELVRGEIDPGKILRQYKSDNRNFTLAAKFSGPVSSLFPDGPPKVEKNQGKEEEEAVQLDPHLDSSSKDLNMVVFADTDLLTSRFWVREQNFFGQNVQVPVSNNADFLINALDNMVGSQDLISLRSRGISVRPFYKIRDLKTAAEQKYRNTEQTLTAKLKELQEKLSGINSKKNNSGKEVTLTSEQTKAFNKFREEMLLVRKQLREVQHNLRKDIESVDGTLKIINIWLVPVLVAVLAIFMAIIRRRRFNAS
jgi:ABC-type uncharacterized transport system involved in gliding motility auxiliary subunit